MKVQYTYINATKAEKIIIDSIVSYIEEKYSDKLNWSNLKYIEVVDRIEHDVSGTALSDRIILSRSWELGKIYCDCTSNKIHTDDTNYKLLFCTIYHELWHNSTNDSFEYMYEYMKNCKDGDIFVAYSYFYWTEYVALSNTVFTEIPRIPEIMNAFCEDFVRTDWHKIAYGYSSCVKAMPYYLTRSRCLKRYRYLTKQVKKRELRKMIHEFDRTSRKLIKNKKMDEVEKAQRIERIIRKYLLSE